MHVCGFHLDKIKIRAEPVWIMCIISGICIHTEHIIE